MMAKRTTLRNGENFLPMTVDNISFLLDRLGQDCHPLQYLRELTQNSIEAISRTGKTGEIIWDVDWTTYDISGVKKLCITDNGIGMTGMEMTKFINQLSSSASKQSMSGNFGVGAKIAAATRNPAGVVYLSWKNDEGAMIRLYRDPKTEQYGLEQFLHQDGAYEHYMALDDGAKPDLIENHGTKVVLHGNSPEADTLQAPQGAASPSRWISKYLNTRYFRFPEGITVRAREGWDFFRTDKDRNVLRTLTGQKQYLDNHSQASGVLRLTNARAHWWILKDEPAISNNSGYIESAGHVAALYCDELYEHATARSGMSRLQQFGVTFGYKFVVIYIEPTSSEYEKLTTNTARTELLIDNQPLPWSEWATEFREHMPDEIRNLVESLAAKAINSDHEKSIRDRLKDIMDLFRISRYRPTTSGEFEIDGDSIVKTGNVGEPVRSKSGDDGSRSTGSGGSGTNVYTNFEKPGGLQGSKVKPDPFPKVTWVTAKDGTRLPGDIEDRAAKYIAEQNLLLINADFRVFQDMINVFANEYPVTGVEQLARDTVHGWFEQAIVETVIGVQGLSNSKEWSQKHIQEALSEESLTATVMQRYHIHNAVKRELGSRLGSRKQNQVPIVELSEA